MNFQELVLDILYDISCIYYIMRKTDIFRTEVFCEKKSASVFL